MLVLLRQKQLEFAGKLSTASGGQRRQIEELLKEIEKAISTLSWIVKDNNPDSQKGRQAEPAAASGDPGVVVTHKLACQGDAQAPFEQQRP